MNGILLSQAMNIQDPGVWLLAAIIFVLVILVMR